MFEKSTSDAQPAVRRDNEQPASADEQDGDIPSTLRALEDAVIALVDEPLKMAGRTECTDCHNEDCDPDCELHTCPGHLTPTYSLYMQLYDAVHEARSGAGQGASRPRSLPVGWIDAQRILDELDFAVMLWMPGHGEDVWPTIGRLNAMLRAKYRPQDCHGLEQKTNALIEWAKDIQNLFDPPKVQHISAPCPACGATTARRPDSAGEVVRVPALQIIADKGCTCQVCKYTWTPEFYLHLCRVLGFDLPKGLGSWASRRRRSSTQSQERRGLMSDDLVQRAKEALTGVTPGPWKPRHAGNIHYGVSHGDYDFPTVVKAQAQRDGFGSGSLQADAEFIAAARSLVPELVAEIEKLRAEYDQAVDDWGDNDEQMLADNYRLAAEVERLRAVVGDPK